MELGLEWALGARVLWQVEASEFCRRVLAWHWPGVRRFVDVRDVLPWELGAVDLVCGGFPCQDISAAGKGAGLGGSRSGLWHEFARVVSGVRPAWVVVENVASGASRWVDAVCADLEQRGYEALPVPLSARLVGAPHRRERVFIVAANSDSSEVWDEPERVPRGRASGVCRSGQAQSRDHGAQGALADAQCNGLERVCSGRAAGRSCDGWWVAEPCLGRVADGVSGRVDRLASLGNAVVPQCAEVIGHMILEICSGA